MKKKQMKRMALTLIATLCFSSSGMVVTHATEQTAEEEIGISPSINMTKGRLVATLGRFDGIEGTENKTFSDLSPTMDCVNYAEWAVENHIVDGMTETIFSPHEVITREQLAKSLLRYAEYKELDTYGRDNPLVGAFTDSKDIAPEAMGAVSYCLTEGLLVGKGSGRFDPKGITTVAEVAIVLQRFEKTKSMKTSEIITIPSFDGYPLKGKLDLPNQEEVSKLVIFVNGSGPNTYDNHRNTGAEEFDYYDVFAEKFTQAETAFFRYNTRGVSVGYTAPLYATIDEESYETYLPSNSVKDIEAMIKALQKDSRLKNAKIYLLGWSEGTMIAPLVAQKGNVDGLLLAGYCNETMEDILKWQLNGGSSMIFYKQYFDYDKNGWITKEEFDKDQFQIKAYLGVPFEGIDVNQDQKLDEADFAQMLAPQREGLFKAIEERDDQWIKEHYPIQLTTAWFWGHRNILPNKEVLPTLNIPIYILHGTNDANVRVQGVYDIENQFKKLGKTNLMVHIFEGNNHDLNYEEYLVTGKLPESFVTLFRIVDELK